MSVNNQTIRFGGTGAIEQNEDAIGVPQHIMVYEYNTPIPAINIILYGCVVSALHEN